MYSYYINMFSLLESDIYLDTYQMYGLVHWLLYIIYLQVYGYTLRKAASVTSSISRGLRVGATDAAAQGLRTRGLALEDGAASQRRPPQEMVHAGQQETHVPWRAIGCLPERRNLLRYVKFTLMLKMKISVNSRSKLVFTISLNKYLLKKE